MADQQIEDLQDLNVDPNADPDNEGGGTPELEGEALEKMLAGHGESSTPNENEAEIKARNSQNAQRRIDARDQRKLRQEEDLAVKNRFALLQKENEELTAQLKTVMNPTALTAPTMEDANHDPAIFANMQNEWIQNMHSTNQEEIADTVRQAAQDSFSNMNNEKTQTQRNSEHQETLNKHYSRASALKVSNYETTESAAIEILGDQFVEGVMGSIDNSELVLYHLGKNPETAHKIASLQTTNPGKAAIEIGRISERFNQSKKRKLPPEPEITIDGRGSREAQDDSLTAIRAKAFAGTTWA